MQREGSERSAFLDEACAGDESLRREVDTMLASDEQARSSLERPAAGGISDFSRGEKAHSVIGHMIGPYRITAALGAGGMGEVYLAQDTRLNRPVAIKFLPPESVADDIAKKRLMREAQAAAKLDHPNICTVHDVGEEGGSTFIVMQYVEGETLADRLRRQPLELEESIDFALQVADALVEAHLHGIIHRDIKPQNIMITPKNQIKVLDFGLAKEVVGNTPTKDGSATASFATEPGLLMGTAPYMSPEQVQGKPVDARSDIFSFGGVLYEMLAGRRAFGGESGIAIVTAILRDEPTPLDGVPPELAGVVSRCLQKDPAMRYTQVSDVKSALERLRNATATSREPAPSIAVLPFANLSADKENEYFSDGLAEEILNALSRVPGLKVTARTSAFAFRGKEQDIRKIGEALDVRTVLEGSVRRSGNRIRVTAQLINVADGYHLWSDRYDREMTDVFAVQDEIAQAIVGMLKVRLAAKGAPLVRQAASIEAYHANLKGWYHFFKMSPPEMARSKAYFEEAIALDPEYAPAYLGLARCFLISPVMGGRQAREVMPLAKAAALKAVELDDREPEGHVLLGQVAGQFEYDWNEARRRYQLALAREPMSSRARFNCAQFILMPLHRFDEAIALLEPALQADPLSPFPRMALAGVLNAQGSDDLAIGELHRLLEFDDYWFAHFELGLIYTNKGMVPEAAAAWEKGLQLVPYPGMIGGLAGHYARSGNRPRAEDLLARLDSPELAQGRAIGYGFFHLVCSEFDLAADQFEKAIEARDPSAIFLSHLPVVHNLPRWRALLKKMNLADVGS
ncbi:MAG: protein kinase [Acidobacteriia bacterium]|nr:protein kinase [Terriglobia bacterium]